jgi:hypothetical protein
MRFTSGDIKNMESRHVERGVQESTRCLGVFRRADRGRAHQSGFSSG